MRKFVAVSTFVITALAATVSPAGAAGRPRVDFTGQGSYLMAGDGSAAVAGTATGKPFDGSYTGTVAADDGSLADPGECEPATATLRLENPRGRYLELTSAGTVCGQEVQPPFVVTHVFTGTYEVTASSRKKLVGTDGFLEVRLANDGRAAVFAIDT